MEAFFRAVEKHELTIIGLGFLICWAVIAIIRAVRGEDED